MSSNPLEIFISYSHKDENYLDDFQTHLSTLKRKELIEVWTDKGITPGQEWDSQIKGNLETADIIIFLVSPDFIASDYIHDIEIEKAIEKYKRGENVIIPIVIRTCDFGSLEIAKFQALPKGAKPVSTWADKDEVWSDVVNQLKLVVQNVAKKKADASINSQTQSNSTNSNNTANNSSNSSDGSSQTPQNDDDLLVTISKLRRVIAKDEIEPVIEKMLDITESLDSNLYSNVILLSSRYNGNKRKVNLGILSSDAASIQEARIKTSLISLINDMEKDFT